MRYRELSAEEREALRALVPAERCLFGEEISEDYAHDELGGLHSLPQALIRVQTTEEVSALLRCANEREIPVVVRGSGTGLVGASVAAAGGIMLDTTLMNRILELDEENLTVTVQSGVLLMELIEYLDGKGLFYPPDPGEKSATIGGNISTNAGGMRAVKYGVTRDYVRALTVVLASGEVLRLGGKVVKNSSGSCLPRITPKGRTSLWPQAPLEGLNWRYSLPRAGSSSSDTFPQTCARRASSFPASRSTGTTTAILQNFILLLLHQYSFASRIVVTDRSASVMIWMRSPPGV